MTTVLGPGQLVLKSPSSSPAVTSTAQLLATPPMETFTFWLHARVHDCAASWGAHTPPNRNAQTATRNQPGG